MCAFRKLNVKEKRMKEKLYNKSSIDDKENDGERNKAAKQYSTTASPDVKSETFEALHENIKQSPFYL